AELWSIYQQLPEQSRYWLYQARSIDFNVVQGERVLDIGSGQHPFPFATDLGDIAIDDNSYGRAGADFTRLAGRQVHECDVEGTNFSDKEFGFTFCSHVLEHTRDPQKACNELMRISHRGYIECPSFSKDIWLNTAKISNHHWKVSAIKNTLIFHEYTRTELEGLRSDLLMSMHCAPETEREKAFAALIYLKSRQLNVMFPWSGTFQVEVHWAPYDGVLSSAS
ncbi:MAG: methyltransferase domain-containing protein, partial [Bdellovibrionales bacterium]|nr:methyltransferase domain-containing protein [Bdellovibrionales bacterium]